MVRKFTPEETAKWLETLDRRVSSASAWLTTPSGELLIVKSDYKQYWALPGGLVDKEETPLQAVAREVKEEIDLDIPLDDFKFELVVHRKTNNIGYSFQFIFSASITEQQLKEIKLQESEVEDFDIVSADDVLNPVDREMGYSVEMWARNVRGYNEVDFTNIIF